MLWVIIGGAVLISLPILRRVHLAAAQSAGSVTFAQRVERARHEKAAQARGEQA